MEIFINGEAAASFLVLYPAGSPVLHLNFRNRHDGEFSMFYDNFPYPMSALPQKPQESREPVWFNTADVITSFTTQTETAVRQITWDKEKGPIFRSALGQDIDKAFHGRKNTVCTFPDDTVHRAVTTIALNKNDNTVHLRDSEGNYILLRGKTDPAAD